MKVEELLKEIQDGLDKKTSASKKDEVRVMQTMLNDKEYEVGVYDRNGKIGVYSPYQDSRTLISSIIQETTKISANEAQELAENHQFTRNEASTFIGVGKEFVNTYVKSGRKLPLGVRENSDVALSIKENKGGMKPYPKKVGVDESGNAVYEHPMTEVPSYNSLRVHASFPKYLKNDGDNESEE